MAWVGDNEEVTWGLTSVVMALLFVAEIISAFRIIAISHAHGGAAMLTAAAIAFASIICVTLTTMPGSAKMVLTLAVAATLLLLAATLDPLGAQGLRSGAVETIARQDISPNPHQNTSSAPPILSTRMTGLIADPSFADDLSRRVSGRSG